jgi:probable DNA repair protein
VEAGHYLKVLHPYKQGTLITGHAQLSRQLRRAYDATRAAADARVWESPDIVSRETWITRVWRAYANRDPVEAPVLLTSLQTNALWEKAIRKSDEAPALLDLPSTVAAAEHAWDVLQAWETPFDPGDFNHTAETAAFAAWKQTVERELHDHRWIVKSQLPRVISERIAKGALKIEGRLTYTGFQDLTPADRRLFQACGAVERTAESPYEDSTRVRVTCDNGEDELERAAGWARKKLEADPAARIGIVVLGLAERAAAAARIFDDVLCPGVSFKQLTTRNACHVSSGVPAAQEPLIAAALLALGLKAGLTLSEAGMLLRSPFLGLTRAAGAQLHAELRKHGVERVAFHIDAVRIAFPRFAKAADETVARQRPSQWSAAFSKILRLAGWPGERPLSPVEIETVEQWKALLSELASLDLILPRLDYAEALQRLRQIARSRRSAPTDDDAPVQLMDLHEAAGTRWDALWVAGLDAKAWPAAPRPNPFLPLPLQRAAGMPHSSPERELADGRRVTAELLSSAPEVICSYARTAGEEQLQVSPLISLLAEAALATEPADTVLRRVFAAGTALERQPPDQAPPLPAGTLQQGGMSVLKNQAACPFRAFAIHRLSAREDQEADLGISLSERGTVAHDALDVLWGKLGTKGELLKRSPGELTALIRRCVNEALDHRLGRRYQSPSLDRTRMLEQLRWERLLAEWIEVERARPDFEVVERETKREVEVSGLRLQIKADRIDQLTDGTFAILDYKTSDKISVKEWDGERPDAPQIPLYTVKSEREISAVYFAKLALGSVGLLGCDDRAEMSHRKEEWKHVIDNLAGNFLRGDAAVDPKYRKQTCENCHLPLLCRISDLKTGAAAADEDAGE